MRMTVPALALCALATGATAQYAGEPPLVINGTANIGTYAGLFQEVRTGMLAAGVGVTNIQQWEIRPWTGPFPAPKPGLFYLAFTHNNGAYTGLWDMTAPAGTQFTARQDFQNLNQTNLFSVSVSRDHLLVVCDRGSNLFAGYSVRPNVLTPWTHWEDLNRGFGYVDSKTDKINGVDHFFWAAGGRIAEATLDRTAFNNPAKQPCTGLNTIVSNPPGSTGLHSHDTLVDDTGSVRAFILSRTEAQGDADCMYASSIYNLEGPKVFYDTMDWLNNPGSFGGFTLWAHNTSYLDPDLIRLFATSGDRVSSAGGLLTLRAFVPFAPSSNVWVTQYLMGLLGTQGFNFNLPNVQGNFGLLPGSFVILPPLATPVVLGGTSHVFPLPPLPSGLTLTVQCVGFDPVANTAYLSNTAPFVIQ